MKIDVKDFQLISEADYEPEVDMLRVVVNCRRQDLEMIDLEDELLDLAGLVDRAVKELA